MSLVLLGILNSQAAAAGGATSFDLLETIDVTGSPSLVSFTGLDSYTDYKHLQIRATMQGSIDNNLVLRFNGDSGTNYWRHLLSYDPDYSTALRQYGGGAFNNIELNEAFADDVTTNNVAPLVMDILDFSSTNKYTTVRALTGQNSSDRTSIYFHSALWLNTAALTSIALSIAGGTMTNDTRFSLYGIKG